MAAPVSWRIKGIDQATREMAVEAAARSGLSVGEWLERAIDNNVDTPLDDMEKPLVSADLLESAREPVIEEDTEDTGGSENHKLNGEQPTEPDDALDNSDPQLPLLAKRPKKQRENVPKVSPMLMTAESGRPSGLIPRIIGGILVIVLFAGVYWAIDENTQDKLTAETDAVAGRSPTGNAAPDTTASKTDDTSAQAPVPKGSLPEESATLTPLQKLTTLASSGNAQAQQELGLKYIEGNGVPRDLRQGALWLEQSAKSGMPNAQYNLGILYQKGQGVSADMNAAYQWFLQAARQGHVRAQYNLGTFYAEGKGTKQSYPEAIRWFTRASKEGFADAHYSLGQIYEDGLGVKSDRRKAATYYRSALAAGSSRAAGKLARLEPALREIAVKKDAAELEKDLEPLAPGAAFTPAKDRILSASGITKLQRLLKRLDLEPGPADGVMGARTREAIRLYQRFAGLPVDGKPTLELLLDLRQVVGAMSGGQSGAGPLGDTP